MTDTIKKIFAREILSSGGDPTVEATVELTNGIRSSASVPFGVSAGAHEAHTLIDGDPDRYDGKGMKKACAVIEGKIASALTGMSVSNQQKIDQAMIALDGTPNKKILGGNSILAVSLACARAGATVADVPLYAHIRSAFDLAYPTYTLPKPMMVVLEGGAHADHSTDVQEYLLSVSGAPTVKEAVRWGEETYHELARVLKEKKLNTNVGNEGAFAPAGIESNEAPIPLLVSAITRAGYVPGKDIHVSLDIAASEFFDAAEKKYILKREGAVLSSDQMIALMSGWMKTYPILSIEDGLAEDDWEGWKKMYAACGSAVRIIGDDLTVTNPKRLERAIAEHTINGVLIKLNQIGTLSETVEAVRMGQQNGFWQIISHRGGGETDDTFMIDLAVAVNAEYVKVGPARGERTAKYNRLMEIEDEVHKV
ncbi:MAG: phosphopyruvate hydratase [Patescibacteria group bacterium]|jgi:enolase